MVKNASACGPARPAGPGAALRGGAALPAGARRRRSGSRAPGPSAGPAPLLGARPKPCPPGPSSAAALTASFRACAAHLRGPPKGRGGDEVSWGQGTGLRGHTAHRAWEGPPAGSPGGGPEARAPCRLLCAAAGRSRAGCGPCGARRVLPVPGIAARPAARRP